MSFAFLDFSPSGSVQLFAVAAVVILLALLVINKIEVLTRVFDKV